MINICLLLSLTRVSCIDQSYQSFLVVLVGTEPIDVKLNQSLDFTFDEWGKEFEITVDVFINNFPPLNTLGNGTQYRPYGALFSFNNITSEGGNGDVCCSPGTRVPAVFTAENSDDELVIAMNGVGENDNDVFKFGPVSTKQWFTLCISQKKNELVSQKYFVFKIFDYNFNHPRTTNFT